MKPVESGRRRPEHGVRLRREAGATVRGRLEGYTIGGGEVRSGDGSSISEDGEVGPRGTTAQDVEEAGNEIHGQTPGSGNVWQ